MRWSLKLRYESDNALNSGGRHPAEADYVTGSSWGAASFALTTSSRGGSLTSLALSSVNRRLCNYEPSWERAESTSFASVSSLTTTNSARFPAIDRSPIDHRHLEHLPYFAGPLPRFTVSPM